MFENVLQELRQMNGPQKISIPIHPDKDGYIDKECPDEKCMFQFKVHEEDWKNIFHDDKVFCPMCRHEANSQSWFTTEQINEGKNKVREYLVGKINNAFHEDARNFNARQSRNSFLKLSMKFTGKRGVDYILPMTSKEEMELKIQCKECNARYAVIGSAFFCPNCGHNSAEETFSNTVKKIEIKLNNLETIKDSLLASVGKDDAEITCRSLIESGLNDCVVALQRFCEVSFVKKAPAIKVRFNAFQNIDAGSDYWKQATGQGYSDWITQDEMNMLKILFQKRHLLAHTEGIVDQKYIDNSGDSSYRVGQRIVVRPEDVRTCLNIVTEIVKTLKTKL
ncbi:MAG: hypothetical protein J0I32_10780 [Sphingobacteriales bacterium]|nr:hypothetical protein [Sphingobacteriales bacterium]OJW01234.1 MAG: hypothetical protein BGO52_07315 [Sphingobacteriales bacterium 44-61]